MYWIVVFSCPAAAENFYHSFRWAVALNRPPVSLSLGAAELGRTYQLIFPTWVGDPAGAQAGLCLLWNCCVTLSKIVALSGLQCPYTS